MIKPIRLQRSRAKGFKLISPNGLPNVYVDRSTHLGNPFIVGIHGTVKECLDMFKILLTGYICFSVDKECVDRQRRFLQYLQLHREELRGKNLVCWCRICDSNGKHVPCHADILLKYLNGKSR